ncbi:MAG TPA: OmpA family protein [Thermoanaerobaculia bacterium]|nr:OmpA family protein [Thermoanaerobaculia bacterium]
MRAITLSLTLVLALVGSAGCATKKYVRGETQAVHTRVDGVEGQVEEAQTRIGRNEQAIGEASRTAQDALQRATEAGKLAEGKLLYETVLTDEKVKFGFDVAELSPEAKAALDEFANGLVSAGKGVYIEIQGHTDAIGGESYNEHLGLERAEAVRRYLSQQHKFPLHRINVISYGESAPVSDNDSREGRAQNRRVALVVLS